MTNDPKPSTDLQSKERTKPSPLNPLVKLANEATRVVIRLRDKTIVRGRVKCYTAGFVKLFEVTVGTDMRAFSPPWLLIDRSDIRLIYPVEEVKGERG